MQGWEMSYLCSRSERCRSLVGASYHRGRCLFTFLLPGVLAQCTAFSRECRVSGDSYTHGVGTQLLNKSGTLWACGAGKPGGRADRRPGCVMKTPCPSPSHTPSACPPVLCCLLSGKASSRGGPGAPHLPSGLGIPAERTSFIHLFQ